MAGEEAKGDFAGGPEDERGQRGRAGALSVETGEKPCKRPTKADQSVRRREQHRRVLPAPERSETPRPLSLDTTLLGWRGFGLFKHRFYLLFLFAGTERGPVGTGGDGGVWWAALPFPAPLLFFKHSFQFFLGVGTLLGCFSGVLFLFLQTYCAKKPPENVLFEPDLVRTKTKKRKVSVSSQQ